jgi:hypothetical protein
MRDFGTLAFLAALGAAGAASAQPSQGGDRTTQCIDAGGQLIPAVCQTPGSRLNTRELICNCTNGGSRVEVPVCAKGQNPPAEGKALNVARREASRDGSLFGDTLNGQPICVAPRGR